jgi:hypothetical protein
MVIAMECRVKKRIVVALVAASLVFVVVGQFVFSSSPEYKPPLPQDSYVLLQSDLSYAEVSASYAWSIYNDVRQILSGFLSADGNFFYDADTRNDIADSLRTHRNILIDLHCQVRRDSSTAILSVQIDRHDTDENLFTFVTSAPFFQPEFLLSSFALAFPDAFALPVVREYSYVIPPRGFRVPKGVPSYAMPSSGLLDLGGLLPLGLSFDDVVYYRYITDLEKDLAANEGVPAGVIRSAQLFRSRRSLESVVGGFSLLTAVGTFLVAIGMLESKQNNPHEDIEAPPTWLWITSGAATLAFVGVTLEFSAFPPQVTTVLNNWCCPEEK